jgi:fluoroquinolone resistance protein
MFQDDDCTEYYEQTFTNLSYTDKISFKIFEECIFSNCNFNDVVFKSCKFRYCQFFNCNLSLITVASCSFLNVNFKDCKIIGVNWTYSDSLWPPITFLKCNISQSNFLGLKLKSIFISECVARDVDFRECDLSKSTLTSNDFKNSLFGNTNLIKADLTHSTNYMINLLENKIHGAKFSLPDAISLLNGVGIEIT